MATNPKDQVIWFRPMGRADLDEVLANEVRAYAFPWTRGIFADCLRSQYECWVACLDNAIIGHGVLSLGVNEAHLLNVCVRRDEQGNGHGRFLVNHMLDQAFGLGADVVFLEVRPSNLSAVHLYESLGFAEVGVRKNYYPTHVGHEDARVLALQFADRIE